MDQDVDAAKRLDVDGVVFGILREDGQVDIERTRHLVNRARPLKVTFHRAFDMSRDLMEALEAVIPAGVDRVLTSGGEQRVEDGASKVKELNQYAAGRIAIMAGGGITESNAHRVIATTGVSELHARAAVSVASPMWHRNERISMGAIQGRENQRVVVTEEKIRRLLNAAINGNRHRRETSTRLA